MATVQKKRSSHDTISNTKRSKKERSTADKIAASPFVVNCTSSSFKILIASLSTLLNEVTFLVTKNALKVRVIHPTKCCAISVDWEAMSIDTRLPDAEQPLIRVNTNELFCNINLKISDSSMQIFLDEENMQLGLKLLHQRANVELFIPTLEADEDELPQINKALDLTTFIAHLPIKLFQPYVTQREKLKDKDILFSLYKNKGNQYYFVMSNSSSLSQMVLPLNSNKETSENIHEISWDDDADTTHSTIELSLLDNVFPNVAFDTSYLKKFLDSLNFNGHTTIEIRLCLDGPLIVLFNGFMFLLSPFHSDTQTDVV